MIYLLSPGPIHYPFIKEGLAYFLELAKKWVKIKCIFPKIKTSFSDKNRLKEEAKILSKYIPQDAYLIVLDERGKAFTTKEWADFLKRKLEENKELIFLVGGPEGVAKEIKDRANLLLRLSNFTLNHEITLLVLSEALFRALSVIKGHPYHRE